MTMDGKTVESDTRTRVVRVVQTFLARRDLHVDPDQAQDLQSLGVDSLGFTELVFDLAEEFDIDDRAISDETLRALRTLDDLVSAIDTARRQG